MIPAARWALFAAGLALCAALPFAGHAMRSHGAERCALDGVTVPTATRVEIVDESGSGRRSFCCVDCATAWMQRAGPAPRKVFVTDEASGSRTPAADALFVKSRVVAFAVTGCRIHVFTKESDARGHIAEYGGTLLTGTERPFGGRE